MFEYFPENYTWNLAFMSGMNRGGALGDLDEACRSLKTHAGRRDSVAQQAWFESFVKVAERYGQLISPRQGRSGNAVEPIKRFIAS